MDKLINLGQSIRIKGDLIGSEDLTIQGSLEGKITLEGHVLTIGENGNIKAHVRARGVVVAGDLIGDIVADDRVEVASTGSLVGDITAARVVLADGARFRGSIDMEPSKAAAGDTPSKPATTGSGPEKKTEAAVTKEPARVAASSGTKGA
jgi:cytoskeletal protein CcmA (bactofilin family)